MLLLRRSQPLRGNGADAALKAVAPRRRRALMLPPPLPPCRAQHRSAAHAFYADKPLPRVQRNPDGTFVVVGDDPASNGNGNNGSSSSSVFDDGTKLGAAVAAHLDAGLSAAAAAAAAATEAAAKAAEAVLRFDDAAELARPSKSVPVNFHLAQYVTRVGQVMRVVGAPEELGAWDPRRAPDMAWQEGHAWSLDVELPAGVPIEFKVAMVERHPDPTDGDGNYSGSGEPQGETSDGGGSIGCVRWEDGPNRAITLPATIRAKDWHNDGSSSSSNSRGGNGDGGGGESGDGGESGGGGGGDGSLASALWPPPIAVGTLPVGAVGVAMAWEDQDQGPPRLAVVPRRRLVHHRLKWLEMRLEALARRRLRAAAQAAARALVEGGGNLGSLSSSLSSSIQSGNGAPAGRGGVLVVDGDDPTVAPAPGAGATPSAAGWDEEGALWSSSASAAAAASYPTSDTAAQRVLANRAAQLLAEASRALDSGDAAAGVIAMLGGSGGGTLAAAALLEELTAAVAALEQEDAQQAAALSALRAAEAEHAATLEQLRRSDDSAAQYLL